MVAMKDKKFKRGMVFGVFDGLHPGHRHFLGEAQSRCETLTVIVAPDAVVSLLKNHPPRHPLPERLSALQEFDRQLHVVAGDEQSGSWNVLKKYPPDIVLLGYDQKRLAEELATMSIPFLFLPPFQPDKYKTSLMQ